MIAQGVFYFWLILNFLLLFYVSMEFVLLLFAIFSKKRSEAKILEDCPTVCIQLPIYNEKYVVERLIDVVCKMDYPKDKLEIQVLDDSTDETIERAAKIIQEKQLQGYRIEHVRRPDRLGFKAGALDYGLNRTEAEFIAIFDADFLPDQNFLRATLPHFSQDNVGVVQSRWAHTNDSFSFLTKAQAIMLNTHFSVEQLGRNKSGAFINFNGTAGIWRKACIEDAGGWAADTLTEDLDLSFRAQLKGWSFNYLYDVESPAELPVTLDAYKTQQYRWSKGAAECIRKNMRDLWSSKASLWAKLAGTVHLSNSSVYIVVLLLVITSPIIFWMNQENVLNEDLTTIVSYSSLFVSTALPLIFLIGHLMATKNKLLELLIFPVRFYMFLAISIGISLYMVVGVIEGYFGRSSEFVRTPKYNLLGKRRDKLEEDYSSKKEINLTIFEALLMLFGLGSMSLGFYYLDPFMIAYGLMIFLGYTLKLFYSRTVFRF